MSGDLTSAQLAVLEDLVWHRGRHATAKLLGTTVTMLNAIETGRTRAKTIARVAAKIDELARPRRAAP